MLKKAGFLSLVAVAVMLAAPVAVYAQSRAQFDLPPQPLAASLRALGSQTSTNVLFDPPLVEGRDAPALKAEMTLDQAFTRLLAGTGLKHRFLDEKTVMVISAAETLERVKITARTPELGVLHLAQNDQADSSRGSTEGQGPEDSKSKKTDSSSEGESTKLQEIVVTGSHIRGTKGLAAQTITFDRAAIEATGAATVPGLFERLPQNFGAFGNDGTAASRASALQGGNLEYAAGIDLRGLGPQSTLVLVNGRRKSGAVQGRVVDVSAIPLALVDRVDVLTGGHTAIYGADAVAGVVNFVLRRHFDGAQTRVRYGEPAHSGGQSLQFSQVIGRELGRGGFVAAYDYSRETDFDVMDTGLIRSPSLAGITPSQLDLFPDVEHQSLFLSGEVAFTEGLRGFADLHYAKGKNSQLLRYATIVTSISSFNKNASDGYDLTLGTDVDVGENWHLELAGNYSRTDVDRHTLNTFNGVGTAILTDDKATVAAVSVVADGPLPAIGRLRPNAAIGIDYRTEELTVERVNLPRTGGDRHVRAVFAELNLPLIEGGPTAMRNLELSLAARYDDYSDVGGTLNPQAGLVWGVTERFKLRGAYSTAFRAPTLQDTTPSTFVNIIPANNPTPGDPPVAVVFVNGNDPQLDPEEATTWNVGFDFTPSFHRGTSVHASYFDVDYTGRLDVPAAASIDQRAILQRADRYAGLLISALTPAQLNAIQGSDDDGAIPNSTTTPFNAQTQLIGDVFPGVLVFNNRLSNIAVESVRGIDVGVTSRFDMGSGELSMGLNGNYLLDHDRAVTAASPSSVLLNDVGRTPDLRLRMDSGWHRGPYGAALAVNYTTGYEDTIIQPARKVDAWTTVDLVLSWSGANEGDISLLRGMSIRLSALNLLNTDPPEVLTNVLGPRYDPANASPLGRQLSLQIARDW